MLPTKIIKTYEKIILDDNNSRTLLPIIEKKKGEITNEQCLTQEFFGNIFMGTAERCFYIDNFHELCLCVHYNFRMPGTFKFIPEFRYYISKHRICIDLHHKMGEIIDKSMIIKEYKSIDLIPNNALYKEFVSLKNQIENNIRWKTENPNDPFEYDLISCFQFGVCENGGAKYRVYETPISERKEMVQFYLNNATKKWEAMSISEVELSDLMMFFEDFDSIDKNELHLRRFLPIYENAECEGSTYHNAFEVCKSNYSNYINSIR